MILSQFFWCWMWQAPSLLLLLARLVEDDLRRLRELEHAEEANAANGASRVDEVLFLSLEFQEIRVVHDECIIDGALLEDAEVLEDGEPFGEVGRNLLDQVVVEPQLAKVAHGGEFLGNLSDGVGVEEEASEVGEGVDLRWDDGNVVQAEIDLFDVRHEGERSGGDLFESALRHGQAT